MFKEKAVDGVTGSTGIQYRYGNYVYISQFAHVGLYTINTGNP